MGTEILTQRKADLKLYDLNKHKSTNHSNDRIFQIKIDQMLHTSVYTDRSHCFCSEVGELEEDNPTRIYRQ